MVFLLCLSTRYLHIENRIAYMANVNQHVNERARTETVVYWIEARAYWDHVSTISQSVSGTVPFQLQWQNAKISVHVGHRCQPTKGERVRTRLYGMESRLYRDNLLGRINHSSEHTGRSTYWATAVLKYNPISGSFMSTVDGRARSDVVAW